MQRREREAARDRNGVLEMKLALARADAKGAFAAAYATSSAAASAALPRPPVKLSIGLLSRVTLTQEELDARLSRKRLWL